MNQSRANPSPAEIPCFPGITGNFLPAWPRRADAYTIIFRGLCHFGLVFRTGNLKWQNREFSEAEEGKSHMAGTQAARLPSKALLPKKMKAVENSVSSVPQPLEPKLPPEFRDEDFQPIALLLTPNPPEWLKESLHLFCCVVWRDRVLEEERPTRAQLLQMLTEVKDAVDSLMKVLVRADLLAFLGSKDLPRIMFWQMNLQDIRDRASNACQSRELVDKDGRARPGQGRAYAAKTLSARNYCALVLRSAGSASTEPIHRPGIVGRRRLRRSSGKWRSAKRAELEGPMCWRPGGPILG
jgi:hypothetical protein